jgi:Na+/phosphate symporter
MTKELKEKTRPKHWEDLCPTVDNLRLMLGAARHAFNRHSAAELEELAKLQDEITLDLDLVFEEVELALEKTSETEKPYWLQLQGILTHLEIIGANIAALEGPIRKKIKSNVMLSDKDVMYLNNLFSCQTGLMRSLVDIFKKNDPVLKKYLIQESERLIAECFAATAEHETRMMDNFGQPQAWSVYLSLLEHTRIILHHLIDIIKLLK